MSQPPPDLASELKDADLIKKLDWIKAVTNSAWDPVKLYWYTDHGPSHSGAVIGNIAEIIKPLYTHQHPGRLNEEEVFILLACGYVHDMGMQNLNITGLNIEQLSPNHFKEIRKMHAAWSAQYIEKNLKTELGDYLDLVMLIAPAHATDYFEKGIRNGQLRTYKSRYQREIRSHLLAALLLMGDELDLPRGRINNYLKFRKEESLIFPPESLLHIFKHHYISEVRIVDAPGKPYERNIEISWQFPEDSTEYADDLKRWVYYKLRRQREVTRDSLAAVGLTWGEIRFFDEPAHCLPFPGVARAYLLKETLERRLINREELLRRIKDYLELTPPGNEVLVIGGEDGSDQEAIWDWLKVYVDCLPNLRLLPLDFNIDSSPRMDYINSETEALLDPHTAGILVISNLQNLEPGVRDWLLTQRLPQMVAPEKRNVAIAMSLGEPPEVSGKALQACPFSLHRFSVQQVADHLVTKLGYPLDDASVWALHFKPADCPAGEIIGEVELLQSNLEIQGQVSWKH